MSVATGNTPTQNLGFARTGQESDFPNLWKNLVAAYVPSLGPSNTTLYDVGSGKHHGSLVNTPTFVAGKFGYALKLNSASSQRVSIPDQTALQVQAKFTLATWVNFADLSNSYRILTKCLNNGGTSNSFELHLNTNTIGLSGNGGARIDSTHTVVANTWYFITATYDGTTSKLYVNGEFSKSGTGTAYAVTTRPVFIGYRDDGYGALNGQIGTTLIYGRTLSASEVKQLMVVSNSMFLVPSKLRLELTKPVTVNIKTITSNSTITGTTTQQILSQTDIQGTTTQTTNSDSYVIVLNIKTINSDTDIAGITTKQILSNTDIQSITNQTIDSDSKVVNTSVETINSDSDIAGTTIQGIFSQTTIQSTTIQTVDSDSNIFGTSTENINSDTNILVINTKTILSDTKVVLTQTKIIDSDAIIFKPLDLSCTVSFTKNSQKDFYIESEVIQVTPDVPFNVTIANVGSGDAARIEWEGTSLFYNVYMVETGPVYTKMNAYLISDHFYVVGGLQESVEYTFVVRGADGQG
jgi:hypothetical protein